MKKLILLTLLLIGNYSFSQKIESQTSCSGSGSANQGTYTYEATLSASSYLPGMKDVRYKLALGNYKITSFKYKGIDASTVDGVNLPIYISKIQAKVNFSLEYYSGNLRANFNNLSMLGVQQGQGDYGDLSSSQIESLKNKFNIKDKNDFYNLNLRINSCKISKSYFEELSKIRTLIDNKIRNEKERERNKIKESKNINTSSNNINNNTSNNTNSSSNNNSNNQNTENQESDYQKTLEREHKEWADKQEAKRIATKETAEKIAPAILAIGKMLERSPEKIARSKKRRARSRERRQVGFAEYKKTYKSSIRVFGGLTMAQFNEVYSGLVKYTETKLKTGFHAGIIAELFPLSETLAFETGLSFESKGQKSETILANNRGGVITGTNQFENEEIINLYYLEVPILLKLSGKISSKSSFYVNVGPYLGIGVFGNSSSEGISYSDFVYDSNGFVTSFTSNPFNQSNKIEFGSEGINRIDYGYRLGIGLEVNKISIGLNLSNGLRKISEIGDAPKNVTYNLSIGYKIK